MKQIIVNVSELNTEEKQRINEALEKITGAIKLQAINPKAGWLFAQAQSDSKRVTWRGVISP